MKIEGCCDMSWIQMCSDLYELTGDPKYIKEAEYNFYNESMVHQGIDGVKYTYYTQMNRTKGDFTEYIHCCSSSIPRGMYWAIVTLTTVGYGDIHPHTELGQAVAAVVMVMGYGIIAVPTGIVSVELAEAQRRSTTNTQACRECAAKGHDDDASYYKFCGAEL
jgi:hypothetical protein